jgi:hypothetical protein
MRVAALKLKVPAAVLNHGRRDAATATSKASRGESAEARRIAAAWLLEIRNNR